MALGLQLGWRGVAARVAWVCTGVATRGAHRAQVARCRLGAHAGGDGAVQARERAEEVKRHLRAHERRVHLRQRRRHQPTLTATTIAFATGPAAAAAAVHCRGLQHVARQLQMAHGAVERVTHLVEGHCHE